MKNFALARAGVVKPTRQWACAMAVAAIGLGLLMSGCSKTESAAGMPPGGATPVVPVSVAPVAMKSVPTDMQAIGTVQAYSTVNVKSLVQGEIVKAGFKEGDFVQKGQMLFVIDQRPYQAALEEAEAKLMQAKADLAKDQAALATAKLQNERYTKLSQAGVVSREQSDQMRTSFESAEASASADKAAIAADQAAVDDARVELSYCTIRSPMNGRTGSLQIHQGNLVKANDVPIVTINQIEPVYVQFSVPEQYLEQIRGALASRALPVEASVTGVTHPETGRLSFIDNAVDVNTGTIVLKGTFSNPDRKLWPGQFVNVHLTLSVQTNAVVVPTPAVQTGQNGQYVFIVQKDKTVAMQPVVTGTTFGPDTVIVKGLQPGQTVVTDGQLGLMPGAKIEEKPTIQPVQEAQS